MAFTSDHPKLQVALFHYFQLLRNILLCVYVCAKSLQLCLTLCDPMDYSLPGSSVRVILQARILEWVAMPSSRGSSQPRDRTRVSCVSCTGRQVIYLLLLPPGKIGVCVCVCVYLCVCMYIPYLLYPYICQSIISSNLTTTSFTKIHFSYSNKDLYTSIRPNQTISSLPSSWA